MTKGWRSTCLAVLIGLGLQTAVAAPAGADSCVGDCDGDGQVTIEELVGAVAIALGTASSTECTSSDPDGDGEVTVDAIVAAVGFALSGCPAGATPTPTPTPTAGIDDLIPPENPAQLRAWLEARRYQGWRAESARHPSGGPHGGNVRVFLNDIVFDSLAAGNTAHPRGAAVVKELYFGGSTVAEWAVMIKVEDDSKRGRGWYWYEGEGLSGRGLGVCTGCHERSPYPDYVSKDFVLTRFPLQ